MSMPMQRGRRVEWGISWVRVAAFWELVKYVGGVKDALRTVLVSMDGVGSRGR
jgi:hypothetical protein